MLNWPLAAISAICTGVDGYITKKRVEKYGVLVEVNPLIRQVMEDFGKKAGVFLNLGLNATVITVFWTKEWHTALAVFTGIKLGLLALQLKSLQVETYIEKILASARAKLKDAEATVKADAKAEVAKIKSKFSDPPSNHQRQEYRDDRIP